MKANARFFSITSLILLGALSRLIPHIPNFQAVTAIALFGAALYRNKIYAFIVPLLSLALSDCIIDSIQNNTFTFYYQGMEWVYASFILIILCGFILKTKISIVRVTSVSILSSLLIYLITDFRVWLGTMYPHTWSGLLECYTAALPFLKNELLGDLFYCGVLFGSFFLVQYKIPTLKLERGK